MLLEDLALAVAIGAALLLIGLPMYRLLKAVARRERDPLEEAQERLRIAQREAEAARLNREAEKIYERLYDETLTDHRGGARVADEEAAEVPTEPVSKGKGHGQQ